LGAGLGVALGGVLVAAGASAVLAAGGGGAASCMVAAKKVEEANVVHSTNHDEQLRHSRSALSCHEATPANDVHSLPEHVVKQFYFARLAYELDAEEKQSALRKLFDEFKECGSPVVAAVATTQSALGSADVERPWFWQGPASMTEGPKWYLALSPRGVLHLVIRGSQNIQDWLHNFQFKMEHESTVYRKYSNQSWLPSLASPDLSFHQGFWERAKAVAAELEDLFSSSCAEHLGKAASAKVSDAELERFLQEQIGNRVESVELTGHSLGGAVALILHRVWSDPSEKRFRVLRFMLQRFAPEVGEEVLGHRQQSCRSVAPHANFRTTVFSTPPFFATTSDKADSVQEWLWSGERGFRKAIDREELGYFKNAQLLFFNDDPVPLLGFQPTGHQLLHAPLSSVLWLREDAATGTRGIFPVPLKAQRCCFSGPESLQSLREKCEEDHLMKNFEHIVRGETKGLESSDSRWEYVSPWEFQRRLATVEVAAREVAPDCASEHAAAGTRE
jgi:hypothetical protein